MKNVPYTSCMESTYRFTRYQSIWNDKGNLMVISKDSKRKNLGIKAEDEVEVEGVTGDEEVDVDADVGLWPNIDVAILELNSNVPNTVYRKDEVEWIIVTEIKLEEEGDKICKGSEYEHGPDSYAVLECFIRMMLRRDGICLSQRIEMDFS
ncbi:hypothetical protein HZH68_016200 [Vespula germanica]|uniref:Uncharacterized protein n=1 Tax=Vespula germanica TaxID=30212 RepID=A0A834J2B2_VESGE|nr:hypothetical protein HZH68_016200 [Vespula germanica]